MKRKRTITIEFERELLVEKRERIVNIQCSACGAETEVNIPHEEHDEKSLIRRLVQAAVSDKL